MFNLKNAVLLFLLAYAGFLRFYDIGLMQFQHDEAYLSYLSSEITVGHNFVTAGNDSSLGIPLPPFGPYSIAIPALLSSDPLWHAGFVVLLNLLSILLAYRIGEVFFGKTTGLMTALLICCSPPAVVFSRKIQALSLLPVIICAVLYLTLSIVRNGAGGKKIWFLALLYFIALQIQPVVLVLLPGLAFVLWPYISKKDILPLIAVTAIPCLPYAYHLLQTGFRDIYAAASFLQSRVMQGGGNILSGFSIFEKASSWLITGHFQTYFRGADFAGLRMSGFFHFFRIISTLLFLSGLIVLFMRRKNAEAKAVLIITASALVVFLISSSFLNAFQYFAAIYPLQFLIPVMGIAGFGELIKNKAPAAARYFTMLFFAAIILVQHLVLFDFSRYLNAFGGFSDSYGIAFRCQKEAVRFIIGNSASPQIYITTNENPQVHLLGYAYLLYVNNRQFAANPGMASGKYLLSNTFYPEIETPFKKQFLFKSGPLAVYKLGKGDGSIF
ncbi:MAG: glycosyltransferase family 39 protein [Elusimicrobiota bacterium]